MPDVGDGRPAACRAVASASPVRLGDLARIACFRWRTPPLSFRNSDAPFDSGRKRPCRISLVWEAVCKALTSSKLPSVTFAETRQATTLAYLAGLLEGEGSFLRPPPSSPQQSSVALMMTDEDVVSGAALLLETSRQAPPYRREAHHKHIYTARVRGRRAANVECGCKRRAGIADSWSD